MKKLLIFIAISSLVINFKVDGQNAAVKNKCLECHGKLTEKKIIHKPVIDECDKCHKSNGKEHPKDDVEGFALTLEVPQLCYSCHEEKSILKEQVHAPVKEGDCLSCHVVHSSNNEHLLSAVVPGLCYSCHNDLKKTIETAAVGHQAVKEGKYCLNCHSPHSSSEKKMLVLAEPDACYSCHNKTIKVGERNIADIKSMIEKSKYVHGAIENNGCSACHNPHASENKFLLTKSFPSGNYSPAQKQNYELCMDCHESALFEEAQTKESTGFRNGDKNLHFVHVNKDKGRTCIDCHNVHASNNLFLIADKIQFGEWQMPIKFQKLPKGGSCAPGCHSEKKYER
jgi:predicted CXXCH cytochrome family protein